MFWLVFMKVILVEKLNEPSSGLMQSIHEKGSMIYRNRENQVFLICFAKDMSSNKYNSACKTKKTKEH